MAFQDFKYRVHDILGYIEYPKTNENYDHSNSVKVQNDNEGHIIRIETELTYRKDSIDYISKGETDYFIPKTNEEYFDLKYIVVELVYQSYCRQGGHIYSMYSEIPKFIPSVFELYELFKANYTKNYL
jgi:hypothetical protein